MHQSAWHFVRRVVQSVPPLKRVVEFGSRNINGTVKEIMTDTHLYGGCYHGIDLVDGVNVNQVIDAADWRSITGPDWDCVLCCETFEHCNRVREVCESAFLALKPGGLFIVTYADHNREPHSADGDGPPKAEEHYESPPLAQVMAWMAEAGFSAVLVDPFSPVGDLYLLALKAR